MSILLTNTIEATDNRKTLSQHGSYSITIHNQVLTVKAYDAWNIETAISCLKEFKVQAEKLKHKSWSSIIDLTHWELGPPEMLNGMKKLNIWSEKNNQKFEAVIVKNSVQEHLLEVSHITFSNTQSNFFDNHNDALSWLSNSQENI
ncbi:hypothetical protein CMT41_11610 [Colwellia sp. MT41]|uniref:hypothetical protein n=1 Tax=Colwellia sp. MT41 TaxID=58049 RepID=UPI00071759FB|nr:hypothetical protein [Colwellia sp. MT41]ALO35295.1 hypothetical protein CMT41_11610 [Colwellia sp. MT41]